MATVDFSVLFNAENNKFQFIDTSDYAGQSISTSNVLGNFKGTSPSGVVIHNNTDYTAESATAQAGGSNTITLEASPDLDDYTGYFIKITSGTGSGQIRKISAYNDTTKVATVFPYWATAPDNTSDYEVCFSDINLHATYTPETDTDGGYTANTRNTIILGATASTTNDYYNGMWVILDDGQARQISDYVGSTKTATLSEEWTTLPASNTYYINYTFFAPFQTTTNINQTSSDNEITIPTDANGNIEEGNYLFEYSVYDSSLTTYYSASKTFNYCVEFPTLSLVVATNCITPKIESEDTTQYALQNADTLTNDRSNELFYPIINGIELPPVVSTTATVSTGTLYNRTYTSYLKSRLTYAFTDAVYVYQALEVEQETKVVCPAALCDLFCCENSIYNLWQSNISKNSVIADQYKNKFITIMAIKALMWDAVSCNKDTLIDGYVSQILEIGGCTTGCGCTDEEPILITGLGNTGSVTVVAQGNGTNVTSATSGNTTTYTVSLSQAVLNKINAVKTWVGLVNIVVTEPTPGNFKFTRATITAGDNITVTPTVNGGGIITDYEISASLPIVIDNDWDIVDNDSTLLIAMKSKDIPAGTLKVAGDMLKSKSHFKVLTSPVIVKFQLKIEGVDVTPLVGVSNKIDAFVIETCVVFKTNTSCDCWITISGYKFSTMVYSAETFFLNISGLNDWTSQVNKFKLMTQANVLASLRYDYQQIEAFKV